MALPPYSCEDIEAIRGYNDELNHQIKQLQDTLDDTKEKLRKAEEELNKTRAQLRNEDTTEPDDGGQEFREQQPRREQATNSNEINNWNSNSNRKYDDPKNKINDLETKQDDTATKLQETVEFEALKDKVKDLEKKLNDTAAEVQQIEESIDQAKHQQQDQNSNNYSEQHGDGWGGPWNYISQAIKYVTSFVFVSLVVRVIRFFF